MRYEHVFFDLDHTLWDFESNAKKTLDALYKDMNLGAKGVSEFDVFYKRYLVHNDKLWEKYRNGQIRSDELRWKRMWYTLLDDRIGDEKMAKEMAAFFLEHLPQRNILFPYTTEILTYLQQKGYHLHLITNGFEDVQWHKIRNSSIDHFFQHVITSEASMSLKPHPAIFQYAINKAATSFEKSIMIGDNIEADILGAHGVGMDQVFVNHIGQNSTFSPTYTISHLRQLEDIL
ncbi:YjjG family noncanonical pyrimidine nucleotidase [Gynurincola endophyticus]|jgi:putative hydrolase of the HAD superfamily|uniref:YjjG family noncanonical pyrimidine nucleotidase n=1 Tax=Gynurincola endophyticus TaxID=2479004 RepID=UPI000F8DD9C3|nr:YjjG family noncanonical pyrimidine nucleotidase [Gynurincola endophyticus]